ncbi:unnamed protein product [[Candida] boidinii]|uniref:Patatin-like phospholipase domain-containing protein n=1 Tax=Candida boidinii TaxID=5477 RepID=A0A9W6T450_CANBO|nr:hypothetical protein B5S30_g3267 [[Candida] boidinii]GME74144.1 unnamed protein product [[Candida] boidinii]GMF98673.1 unnamed protein product [[Candida] boidinii]
MSPIRDSGKDSDVGHDTSSDATKNRKILDPTSWEADFINEDHIRAFAEALNYNDDDNDYGSLLSSQPTGSSHVFNSIGSGTESPNGANNNTTKRNSQVELISSQSDWTPIYSQAKKNTNNGTSKTSASFSKNDMSIKNVKKKLKELDFNVFQSGWTFILLRYPALILILMWMFILSILYFLVRLYIAFFESFFTWTGERRKLRDELRNATSYEEWISHAKNLDKHLGFDKWRKEDRFYCYDWRTLRKLVKQLRHLRETENDEELSIVLQNCCKSNFAGTENPLLYSQCYYGTKELVNKYNNEVVKSLNHIILSKSLNLSEKKLLFKIISKNYGKTSLCLSGGATFAFYHYGVAKALLDNDLMPNIISGTSGGGLVASLLCTRTNEELKKLINPDLSCKINACSDPFNVWFKRWWKTGARFDTIDWAEKSQWWSLGSMTFKEVYESTGKILNISTVPNDPHSPVILCNHITSPNCVIWSTLLASAAVPGILNPVVLMNKNKDGSISPFSFGSKWKDGSMRTDIPIHALTTLYNSKFSIVSQVNPHVALFFFAPKGSVGRPVSRRSGTGFRGGFLGAAAENLLKLEITKWLKLMKEFELLPKLKDSDWSSIFLQKFSGTITLWPRIKLTDFYYILSDPTPERLETMIESGQSCTFPKLYFIKHRLNIERTIERGKKLINEQIHELKKNMRSNNNSNTNYNTNNNYNTNSNILTPDTTNKNSSGSIKSSKINKPVDEVSEFSESDFNRLRNETTNLNSLMSSTLSSDDDGPHPDYMSFNVFGNYGDESEDDDEDDEQEEYDDDDDDSQIEDTMVANNTTINAFKKENTSENDGDDEFDHCDEENDDNAEGEDEGKHTIIIPGDNPSETKDHKVTQRNRRKKN